MIPATQMSQMVARSDYSARDQKGKVAFYVLLWKRQGIRLELFDDYWKDVHGPVCARLPGQYQYWQYHVSHNEGGLWPTVKGINDTCPEDDQFDGIAELTFESEADRQVWFQAAGILMDDEHNLFSKAIGYNTSSGNSRTYVDGISIGDPNGEVGAVKFHVMVRKADTVSVEAFRQYMTGTFASIVARNPSVLKLRVHLFDEVDNSRPDAAGVIHFEPPEKQYQAAFEIAFSNNLDMEKFFASPEYAQASNELPKYVKYIQPFPERTAYTFVYDGQMTLAGQRSAKVAKLITEIGATNQMNDKIVSLITGQAVSTKEEPEAKLGLGHLLQGVQHVGVTVEDMERSLEFYTEVLGGKLVVGEDNLMGDGMQNTLFQKEELEAIAQGIDPQSLDLPNLRDEKALDIRFISFGNTCVELLHIKNPKSHSLRASAVKSIPSQVGHVNAMHISFHVKENIDLNLFAKQLEEECQKRGFTNVVFNRIIRVKSAQERRNVVQKYNSFKMWNDPDAMAGAPSQPDWRDDPMEGWALFYCKGPSGEQLEFNQVTRKVKGRFQEAQEQYNEATGTVFSFPDVKVSSNQPEGGVSPMSDVKGLAAVPSPGTESGAPPLKEASGAIIDRVKRLFSRGEAFDSEGFITFFTDTPVYQFGNFEICFTKEAIKQSANAFFSQISAVYHEIKAMWEIGDVVFVEMDVAYWRKDGSQIILPCADIFRAEGDKFSELRIFMDVNPVFDPTIPVPNSSSVFTVSQGKRLLPPDTMKKHFIEHPEGKQRVAQGYAPKWSIAGPKWPLGEESQMSSEQLKAVGELSQAIMAQDWEKVKSYLTDDILYKVGSSEPVYGPQAVVDFFKRTFQNTAVFTGHDARKVWEEPNIITIEMDAHYQLVSNKKAVTIACCDVYRLRGNKVSEWRVYADMSPWGA
jgi:catechol 2,3-dioxygenase-like lactoylglutathione lyase family enzyme/limonene-1,2-epoxide hydrolase